MLSAGIIARILPGSRWLPSISTKGALLLIGAMVAHFATDVDASFRAPDPLATAAALEAATGGVLLPEGFVHSSHKSGGSGRKAIIAASALVAGMLVARLFYNAIKDKKLEAKTGDLIIKEGDEVIEVKKSEFLKQNLRKGEALTQLTREEFAQIKEAGLAGPLEEDGLLHFIAHHGRLEPFLKLNAVETALLDEGEDLVDLAQHLVEGASQEDLERLLRAQRIKRGDLVRVKKGEDVLELDKEELFEQIESGGEIAQIEPDELHQLEERGLAERLEESGRLIYIEQDESFMPYIILNAAEREMISQGEDDGEAFIDLVIDLVEGL